MQTNCLGTYVTFPCNFQREGRTLNGLDWNEEMKLELLRLKAELSPQKFRVIGKGIGIGEVKIQKNENPIFAEITNSRMQQQSQQGVKSRTQTYTTPLSPFKSKSDEKPTKKRGKKIQNPQHFIFLKSHIVDILFILSTILVGILSLGLILDFNNFSSGNWYHWLPSRLVEQLGYFSVGAIIYGLFGVYFIFFRFALGKTLGELLIFQGSSDDKKLSPHDG